MAQIFKNNLTATLSSAIDSATISIPVVSTDGFPTLGAGDWFYLTITDKREGGEKRWEIVKVSAFSGNTLTAQRGQDGTTAQAWAAGSELSLRVVASDVAEIQNKLPANATAVSATKLATARTINGVSFDGTADITIVDNTKAPLASPALTGTPTAPTAPVGTNTTQLATTAFVRQAIVAWFNGISGALGRTILTRTTAAEVRGDLELGTAATMGVGTGDGTVAAGNDSRIVNALRRDGPNTSGYLALGSSQATEGVDRSIEIATNTEFGGTSDNHTGVRLVSYMPWGWGSGRLGVQIATGWGKYGDVKDILHTGSLLQTAPVIVATDTTVTLTNGRAVYAVNTTSAARTLTLPANPPAGATVTIIDYANTCGTNKLTIARNGRNIEGAAANSALTQNGQRVEMVYIDAAQGWKIISSYMHGGFI